MLVTGPIPIDIRYDGSKVDRYGVRKRVRKKFTNGLSREAKDFYLEKVREGKYPVIVDAANEPVFGPNSKYPARPESERPIFERELTQAALFDNPEEVTGLPD